MEDLPEEIQLLVLSLLPLKEAARTSILSRSWRKLWTRYPNLCFDDTKDWSTDDDSIKIESAMFIETVNSIIQQHSGIGLNKFSIKGSLWKDHSVGHVFSGIPSISAVKVLNVHANMHINKPVWSSQVHILTTRATCMFMNLRHLAYEITIFTKDPNSYSGILQLAWYLALARHLETLELHLLAW
ncbi:hypothetical protein PAHAL_6G026700 [Panicum hallii]|uniref:F-box domain-containing protein n=1 Tax=Panicum hallii TaxID=206008 RepID=A0A2T8IF21_9POAL|nr:F-box/LRR-repeat protein At1g48400-like isoform X2 [Panicum hallii]PVH36237.1 hypothetical protein PAHAL_6G026700 [Panicum hallii]